MRNPRHFYTFVQNHKYDVRGHKGSAQNVFVSACDPELFESEKAPPAYRYRIGFSFGTTDKTKVTCGNCLRTKKFKQAQNNENTLTTKIH